MDILHLTEANARCKIFLTPYEPHYFILAGLNDYEYSKNVAKCKGENNFCTVENS